MSFLIWWWVAHLALESVPVIRPGPVLATARTFCHTLLKLSLKSLLQDLNPVDLLLSILKMQSVAILSQNQADLSSMEKSEVSKSLFGLIQWEEVLRNGVFLGHRDVS